jgi:hypothetical protein
MTDPTESPGSPADTRLLIAVLLVLVLAAIAQAALTATPIFPLDDAYITLHNAQVLRSGHDANFPGVPALTGATSLVHLSLVWLLGTCMPIVWASWSVSWLAILLLAAGVCRLAAFARMPWHLSVPLLVVALCAADAPYQLLNGIETGLAMAAITWAWVFTLEPALQRSRWLPVLAGSMPFVRPELGLLSLLLLLTAARAEPSGARLRRFALDTGLALACAALGMLAYLIDTGLPWPQTMSVKRVFFAEGCQALPAKLELFGTGVYAFVARLNLTALGLPLFARAAADTRRTAALFIAGFLGAYLFTFPGAVHHNLHRYLYLLLPFCVVGLVLACMPSGGYARVAGILVRAAALGALLGLPRTVNAYRHGWALTEYELAGVAQFVARSVPTQEVVLVHDVGYISTVVQNPLIDAVGLKDPRAARLHAQLTWPSCGAQRVRAIHELALERHARYFVVLSLWDALFSLSAGMRALGWTLEPLRHGPVAYQVYRLTPASVVRAR